MFPSISIMFPLQSDLRVQMDYFQGGTKTPIKIGHFLQPIGSSVFNLPDGEESEVFVCQ